MMYQKGYIGFRWAKGSQKDIFGKAKNLDWMWGFEETDTVSVAVGICWNGAVQVTLVNNAKL